MHLECGSGDSRYTHPIMYYGKQAPSSRIGAWAKEVSMGAMVWVHISLYIICRAMHLLQADDGKFINYMRFKVLMF